MDKKGMIAVYVIIAIIIVALVVGFFVLRDSGTEDTGLGFEVIDDGFDSDIEARTLVSENFVEDIGDDGTDADDVVSMRHDLPDGTPRSRYRFESHESFLRQRQAPSPRA